MKSTAKVQKDVAGNHHAGTWKQRSLPPRSCALKQVHRGPDAATSEPAEPQPLRLGCR